MSHQRLHAPVTGVVDEARLEPVSLQTSHSRESRPTLHEAIDALTDSLVDSVMMAIRNAPLEKLLAEDVVGATVAEIPSHVERRPRAEQAWPSKRIAKRPRPPASPDTPTRSGEAVTEDLGSAADILDPEMVLGLGVPLADPPLAPPDDAMESTPPAQDGEGTSDGPEDAESTPHVQLRENETVARVSNAGIVLRRGRVTATNGSSS